MMWEKPSRSLSPGVNSGRISTVPGEVKLLEGWIGIPLNSWKGLWMVPIGLKVLLMRFFSILGLSRQRLYVGNLIPYGKLIGCAMDSTIRHYQPSDQTALFELSADTAFFGEPVEAFLEDRRLYSDAFVRYYLDYETAYVWVAEGLEGVTGFLLGCAHTAHQSRHWRGYILTRVLLKALSGQYHLGRRTASFAF